MRKLAECIRNDILLNMRNGLLTGIIVLVTVICCVNFFVFMPQEQVAGNSLAVSSWVTQVFIILGSICGFLAVARENVPIQELFQTIGNTVYYKRVSKVILIGMMSVMITLICGSICSIGLKRLQELDIYYRESIQYIVLYWTMPFAISALGGAVIANGIKGKVKYAAVICQMLLLGPMVPVVVEPLLDVTMALYKYFTVFSVGTLNVSKPMNIMFGYDLQIEKVLAGCMMLCSFVILFLAGNRKKKCVKALKGFGVSLFVLALMLNMKYITGKYDYYVAMDMYEVYKDETRIDCNNSYEIVSEDITVQSGLGIRLRTVMSICPAAQSPKIDFVLYSGFDIDDIEVGGARVEWERNDDIVSVMYPFDQGKTYQLEIHYCGKPPAHMYISDHGWILPAYAAWYPVRGSVNSVSFQFDLFEPFFYDYGQEKTEYMVTYIGKDAVYCSLASAGEQCWKGNSDGVTLLLSSWVKEVALDNGTSVVYPVCCKNYDQEIAVYVEELSELYRMIDGREGAQGNTWSKVFVTCDSTYTGHGEKIYDFADHGIVEITRAYLDGGSLCSPNLTAYPLIGTLKLGNDNRVLSEEYVYLYKTMYITMLVREGKLERGFQMRTLGDIAKLFDGMEGCEEFTSIVMMIDQYMTESDLETIELFMEKFLRVLGSGDNITIDKVKKMMEK